MTRDEYRKRLIGERFGYILVIDYIGLDENNNVILECLCDCGSKFSTRGTYLSSGKKDNCGCKRKEKHSQSKRNNVNKYKEGIKHVEITVGDGTVFVFDKEYFNLVKKYTWWNHNGYMTTRVDNKQKVFHRMIMNPKKEEQIDHIDTNRCNNLKSNLRICTNTDNAKNKRVRKNNTTGFVGVAKRENETYRVRIRVDGKEKTIGHYKELKDAVKARLEAELEYYKEFAPQYYLFEQYGVGCDE